MPQKPPSKPGQPGRGVVDPSSYDVPPGATWPGAEDDDGYDERDAIRDLDDPTYGFPIGALIRPPVRPGDEDESTEVALLPDPDAARGGRGGRTPSPAVPRAARFDTPTMEFTARVPPGMNPTTGPRPPLRRSTKDPSSASPRGTPIPPVRRPPAPARPPPQAWAEPAWRGGDSAEFDPAPAPVDNSRDDLVDYADVPPAPPVDLRVVALLVIFACSVLMLVALIVVAAVVYL